MENIKKFVQDDYATSEEWRVVVAIADELGSYIAYPSTKNAIEQVNTPGGKSFAVQDLLLEKATELGFVDESQNLFLGYANRRLRPDYYRPLSGGSGVLMEVERGKTNQNNMDFLDFWKCHICEHAHYLFLIVPNELRQNQSAKITGRPFSTVIGHIGSFFTPRNYTNVRGAVIFGY